MKSFLQRVLPTVFGDPSDRRKTPRAANTDRRAAAPAAVPGQTAGTAATDPPDSMAAFSALAAVGARRPLISSGGDIVGFEFRISDDMLSRLKRRSDQRAQAAYVAAVLTSARLMAQTGRIGFARVPAEWLSHAAGIEAGADTLVSIEHDNYGSLDPEVRQAVELTVQKLRATGTKLGWSAVSGPSLQPDFVLMRQGTDPMAALLEAVKTWPPALKSLSSLATDIANVEDLELALHSGIRYVCGALTPAGGGNESKETRPVPPEVRRVGQLLNQLVTGADTAVIVSQIKGDVGLSYRLLRRINTASFAQLNAGASIDQAVMLLGRNELYRWLSLLLVQFAGSRKMSSALQEIALWRSRLLELLAIEQREEAPGQLFTLGLASMLGLILKMSLTDVVSTLSLPAPAQQALLEQAGPWYVYLQTAMQVEAQTLSVSETLGDQFGGVQRVLTLSDEAWAWAAEHADRSGGRGSEAGAAKGV